MVIVVANLEIATNNFTKLGFEVKYGGKTGPVHNALIFFQDGTYLELTTAISRFSRSFFRLLYFLGFLNLLELIKPTLMQRFFFWFGGPVGVRDWCIRYPDLDLAVDNFRSKGIRTTNPKSFTRKLNDGNEAKWRLAAPENRNFPLMIQDISPTVIRVPFDRFCNHQNGATGIKSIIVPMNSGKKIVQYFRKDFESDLFYLKKPDGEHTRFLVSENPNISQITIEISSTVQAKNKLPIELTSAASIILI